MATPAVPLPTAPTTEVQSSPVSLVEKLRLQREAAKVKGSKANRIDLELVYDNERIEWSVDTAKFVAAVKKSSTGATEGLMVRMSGRFTHEIDGETFLFEIAHAQGGGAYLIVNQIVD